MYYHHPRLHNSLTRSFITTLRTASSWISCRKIRIPSQTKIIPNSSKQGPRMMHMTFYWSREVTLLFSTWKTTTVFSYSLSLLACFLSSFLYQFLDSLRLRLSLLLLNSPRDDNSSDPASTPLIRRFSNKNRGAKGWKALAGRVAEAVLFGVNAGLGYMLMLAVMSFNGGVFLSVVAGLALGYLVFRSGGGGILEFSESNACACA